MDSDDWHKAGYRIESRIPIFGPVYYRHAFDLKSEVAGVIVDYEFADDFHYELLAEDWKVFCKKYLAGRDDTEAFKGFIVEHGLDTFNGKFAFENALSASGIKYKKMAFY